MDPHHFGKLDTDPHQKGDPNSIKVMRIRIRDPVPFWSLDPGSKMGKNLDPDPRQGEQGHR